MANIITSKTRRTKSYLQGCTGPDFRPADSQDALCRQWEENGTIKGGEAAWWKKVVKGWKARDENVRRGLSEDGKRSASEEARFDELHVDAAGKVRDRDGGVTDLRCEEVGKAEDSAPWPKQEEK